MDFLRAWMAEAAVLFFILLGLSENVKPQIEDSQPHRVTQILTIYTLSINDESSVCQSHQGGGRINKMKLKR